MRAMDRLEAMSLLIAAVEAGSFSAASRKLGVPLPTISRKVAELEAHLGTRIEFVARIGRLASGDGWRRWTPPSVTLDPRCRSRPMPLAAITSPSSGAG